VLGGRHGHTEEADALERQARALDPNAAAWAIDHANNTGNGTAPAIR